MRRWFVIAALLCGCGHAPEVTSSPSLPVCTAEDVQAQAAILEAFSRCGERDQECRFWLAFAMPRCR